MTDVSNQDAVCIRKLDWDSDFFGVTCAKATLNNALSSMEWDKLEKEFEKYQFVSIENRNSLSENAHKIGTKTKASLIDVNIQFEKVIEASCNKPAKIQVFRGLKKDERILEMAEFPFSKFVDDPELAKRNGAEVYRHWVQNSFDRPDKNFAAAIDSKDIMKGFILYSFDDTICTIELIAVSPQTRNAGIGSDLFKAVEYDAQTHSCEKIRVGTQLRNTKAINFYHKCGCKQIGCHQIFHLWNL